MLKQHLGHRLLTLLPTCEKYLQAFLVKNSRVSNVFLLADPITTHTSNAQLGITSDVSPVLPYQGIPWGYPTRS